MKIKNIVASLALSFLVAVGGGIVCKGAKAPDFNVANFSAYDTTGNTVYYYGKKATPFYGWNTPGYYDFISTRSLVNTQYAKRKSDGSNYIDFYPFFNAINNVHWNLFNDQDRQAMLQVHVAGDYEYPGAPLGGDCDVYLYPVSDSECRANYDATSAILRNVGADKYYWSRTVAFWSEYSNGNIMTVYGNVIFPGYTHYLASGSSHVDYGACAEYKEYGVPAVCRINPDKVLLMKKVEQ